MPNDSQPFPLRRARSGLSSAGETAIPALVNFLRSTPADLLQCYFAELQLALAPEPVWTEKASVLGLQLQDALETLDDSDRQRVMNDAERVSAMADEAGQAAIFAVTQDTEALEALPNGYARAVWLMLHAPASLDHAEQVRFSDDRRRGRMWDGFVCEPNSLSLPSDQDLSAFKQAVKGYFSSRNVEIEWCSRLRARIGRSPTKLMQLAIYHEARTGERKAFVEGQLDRLLDHPVIEAAMTYESDTGAVEVVAKARETREALVRIFAEHLLGAPFQGDRLRVRQYALDKLLDPFGFPTDPEDNIESVRVTLLRLMPFDSRGERVTLECMRGAHRNIWQMAAERFGDMSPLKDGFVVTQARFTVKFHPKPGQGRAHTLPVTVSSPQGCDLKDRTEREQLIGDKYLRSWGLLRDV